MAHTHSFAFPQWKLKDLALFENNYKIIAFIATIFPYHFLFKQAAYSLKDFRLSPY